jgi:hypothetical protein
MAGKNDSGAVKQAPTVGTFDFAHIPSQITMELVEGWQVALFATGQTVISERYINPQTGEPSEGYVCHMVARRPGSRQVLFSDPIFPSIVWQMVLKRVAMRSVKLQERGENGWALFEPKKTERNKAGRSAYIPLPVTDENDLDIMRELVREYMIKECELHDESSLSELVAMTADVQMIEASQVEEIPKS